MKKVIAIFIIFITSFSISACTVNKTYDDLYLEYSTHLEDNETNYLSTIDFFNHVSSEIIKSVVHVEKEIYGVGSSTGSGVIIKLEGNDYYILTNNHVIYNASTTVNATYTVTDYLGNEYSAYLIDHSEDYDLAILRFTKRTFVLPVIDFADYNPRLGINLSILGYPSYQLNAITMGNVIDYAPIDVASSSYDVINVLFDVLISDAPVKSGSSGSVVINEQFQLVGLVYAGNFLDSSETSEYTFCIPVEKIYEFFQLKQFSLVVES
ncbi:MAG: serine protease [Firmicutes bacterium]|nr:serine protease [Bacillota bacterium]